MGPFSQNVYFWGWHFSLAKCLYNQLNFSVIVCTYKADVFDEVFSLLATIGVTTVAVSLSECLRLRIFESSPKPSNLLNVLAAMKHYKKITMVTYCALGTPPPPPPQKHPPPFFLAKSPLNRQTVQAPLFKQSLSQPSLKVGSFSEPLKY